MFVVVRVLLLGELVDVNDRSLGSITKEKVSHNSNIMKNQGFGFSCGMSLRRGGWSSFSSLKG